MHRRAVIRRIVIILIVFPVLVGLWGAQAFITMTVGLIQPDIIRAIYAPTQDIIGRCGFPSTVSGQPRLKE
jgi:hypothetical protein